MSCIKVLSPQLSNMIAAGEVLERPASAVKELVENSIDAGADRIIVEISEGGKTLIKVTDNGSGMTKEDAKSCFLRHATSKISKEADLEQIATLGFRGEALASIAAVSQVTLETRTEDSIVGTRIVIKAGEIIDISDTGCNVGTTITIEDLFFNTPVRMKFLKSDNTEAGYITEIMEKLIIARPDISFLYIKNKKECLYSAGDNNEFSNLLNIYSHEICDNLIKIDYQKDYIKIKGYVGNEKVLRNNRKNQIFFVNGRVVKNKIFYSAVDEALKEKVMVSKYPFIILDIEIDPKEVDVNVHPTKAEIKFSDDRIIYNHIFEAVASAHKVAGMEEKKTIPVIEKEETAESFSFIPESSSFAEKKEVKLTLTTPAKKEYNKSFDVVDTPKFEALIPKLKEPSKPYNEEKNNSEEAETLTLKISKPIEEKKEEKKEVAAVKAVKDYKIIGQLFSSYVVIEKGDTMYLLDQHAAHERLLFDKLLLDFEKKEIVTQKLLIPCTVKLTPVELQIASENLEVFSGLGFDIDFFSGNEIVVREIPFEISTTELSDTIVEIIDIIKDNKKSLITYKQEKALHTLACKGAIKANMNFSEMELEKLVEDVLNLQDANTCPHGRPIFISYPKKEIEKQFKRIT